MTLLRKWNWSYHTTITTSCSRLFTAEWGLSVDLLFGKGQRYVVQFLSLFTFPIVPPSIFSAVPSPSFHHAAFSSANLLYLPLLPFPSSRSSRPPRVPLPHPGGPSFRRRRPSPSPLLLLYAKQVSARTRRTVTTSQRRRRGLRGEITQTRT